MYDIQLRKYSDLTPLERSKLDYLKIKRLVLRALKDPILHRETDIFYSPSAIRFVIEYFDIEDKVKKISFGSSRSIALSNHRDLQNVLTDLLYSIYKADISKFRTFMGFLLQEARFDPLKGLDFLAELRKVGFDWDGEILRPISGEYFTERHIRSVVEEKLGSIDMELLNVRKGAIESLLSNTTDKARHVSASCRALVNQLMRKLVPDTSLEGEGKIKQRVKKILNSDSEAELIDKTVAFIQSLNSVQAKGDHHKSDEDLAYLIFELTDKLVYFLINRGK